MEDFTQSANINEKWLQNIYENIKKLEDYERLVREGCSSLLEYVQIPLEKRPIVLGLTQFKNLKFFLTEFKLLLADLTPVLNSSEAKNFYEVINNVDKSLNAQRLFLNCKYNANRQLIETSTTEFFTITIDALHNLKTDLFKQIKNILYIPVRTW